MKEKKKYARREEGKPVKMKAGFCQFDLST